MHCRHLAGLIVLGAAIAGAGEAGARTRVHKASIEAEFQSPPKSARPRVYWNWLDGNIARDGIRLDLEWMKSTGLGGVEMFDGSMDSPLVAPHRVLSLSPEWHAEVTYASAEAKRLGLEFGMAASPGWSETGGPWVKPQAAMKKVVWSEVRVSGGQMTITLTAPPAVPGPFQDIPLHHRRKAWTPPEAEAPFYRDVAVLAFRTPPGDVDLNTLNPQVTYSDGTLDTAKLHDGDLTGAVALAVPQPGRPTWVRYAFDQPRTMHALTYAGPLAGRFTTGPSGRIEASDNDNAWRTVITLTGGGQSPAPERTFAFPTTTARYFRVVFDQGPAAAASSAPPFDISELAFVPGARVNAYEDKAGFGLDPEYETLRTADIDAAEAIPRTGVLDLTSELRADGTLNWTPPQGEWTVLRIGYSLTGTVNHPASPEATGLEVDKLSADHVRDHLNAYLGPFVHTPGLSLIATDSWEAGVQNWTEDMILQFKARRGYDPTPFLPVLTGRVVDSAETSDRFLWDYRRTIADLIADNHYGEIATFAHTHGLTYIAEAPGASWPTLADGLQAKGRVDIPMGEFWAMPFGGQPAAYQGVRSDEFLADILETASAAHIYGKPIVAAEALTSSMPLWRSTPWSLKWVADKYMAMGANRLTLHTSPLQPGTGHKPGLTLGPFGQFFTRNETWADMAGPFFTYLSRSSYLLQQGRPSADILYFYGEGAPSGAPYREGLSPIVPEGYAFDYINADALLRLVSVDNGKIVLSSGARYSLLILPPTLDRMTLPLAKKIRELVAGGAIVIGPKPQGSPSLSSNNAEVRDVVAQVWGQADGYSITSNTYGKGKVYWGASPAEVLEHEGPAPDFTVQGAKVGSEVVFAHRHLDRDVDIYFVSNQTDKTLSIAATFRAAGRLPELWRADTGSRTALPFRSDAGRTTIPLTLAPYDAIFVVFRRPTHQVSRSTPPTTITPLTSLTGSWRLSFPADWGAPRAVTLPALTSWSDNANSGVKYFSGTATYEKRLHAPRTWFKPGTRMVLDLGEVKEVAEVLVNGRSAGVAWKPPYTVDITDALRPGDNRLEIKVANLWLNRIVGDQQPGVEDAYTFASPVSGGGFLPVKPIDKDTPLLPSGLLGPVTLTRVSVP